MTDIQAGIPMPNGARAPKYPWENLQLGDSFVHNAKRTVARVHAYQTSKRLAPMKFSVREVVEDGRTVCRVWRTA